ncbi:MAG TPA: glycosyltransferase family 4 protein [Solirubrobacteraceae bacterium]|nr:glycosyltransferase family 4 protein [Solirubrobacteraceae bacterium]
MVLFVHNRYRTTGGEERTVEDLLRLVREQLHEPAALLARGPADAASATARTRSAIGLLGGGLRPAQVAAAVRESGARVVHAHNLLPSLGWRALAAARAAGARVVLHLHQYRLVCAIGVCFTHGEECTRCHGRNTLPGVRLNCRGSVPEALAYGASLALWQRRMLAQVDAVIVPSAFARERLRALGASLPWERVHVLPPPLRTTPLAAPGAQPADAQPAGAWQAGAQLPGGPQPVWGAQSPGGRYALVASRLSPEKGVDVAIDACRLAGMALVIAGEGPEREALLARARAGGGDVRFLGGVEEPRLAQLRAGAAIALVPSRSSESFGLAAAEAMAAGVPVAASDVGALSELVERDSLVAPADAAALAGAIARLAGDRAAGERARERVRALCAPEVVARSLASIYDGSAST